MTAAPSNIQQMMEALGTANLAVTTGANNLVARMQDATRRAQINTEAKLAELQMEQDKGLAELQSKTELERQKLANEGSQETERIRGGNEMQQLRKQAQFTQQENEKHRKHQEQMFEREKQMQTEQEEREMQRRRDAINALRGASGPEPTDDDVVGVKEVVGPGGQPAWEITKRDGTASSTTDKATAEAAMRNVRDPNAGPTEDSFKQSEEELAMLESELAAQQILADTEGAQLGEARNNTFKAIDEMAAAGEELQATTATATKEAIDRAFTKAEAELGKTSGTAALGRKQREHQTGIGSLGGAADFLQGGAVQVGLWLNGLFGDAARSEAASILTGGSDPNAAGLAMAEENPQLFSAVEFAQAVANEVGSDLSAGVRGMNAGKFQATLTDALSLGATLSVLLDRRVSHSLYASTDPDKIEQLFGDKVAELRQYLSDDQIAGIFEGLSSMTGQEEGERFADVDKQVGETAASRRKTAFRDMGRMGTVLTMVANKKGSPIAGFDRKPDHQQAYKLVLEALAVDASDLDDFYEQAQKRLGIDKPTVDRLLSYTRSARTDVKTGKDKPIKAAETEKKLKALEAEQDKRVRDLARMQRRDEEERQDRYLEALAIDPTLQLQGAP